MNLAERIESFKRRGFSEERAIVIVLMREAAIILFNAFPNSLVLIGGANLIIFHESVRHSADLVSIPIENSPLYRSKIPHP